MKPIQTLVPDQSPIELVAYYPNFSSYYPECELQTKRWFVDHVEPDWVMFDAGANIGYYSILFSRLAPQGTIYAFEPTETIEMLRANLEHNGSTNVSALDIALGRVSGAREDSVFRIWGEEPERRVFEFAKVDDMVMRLSLDRLDCIKIDVDSFDLDVLRGSENTLKRLNPWVVVELNHGLLKRNQSVREALEWLYSIGYRGAHITDDENYIFRRDEHSEKSGVAFPSMLLSFETQPVFIPPIWDKSAFLEDVFRREPQRHNLASAFFEKNREGGEHWNLTVPGPQWSYAASWPRTERVLPAGPIVVEVVAEVSGGAVGIGCVGADALAYIGNEVQANPLPVPQSILVVADRGCDVGFLLVRNTDSNGTSANVRVRSIAVYEGAAATERPPSGLLSSAKRRVSLAECSAALNGAEPSSESAPQEVTGIDIVPVSELGQALGLKNAFVPEIRVYRHLLVDFKCEIDEAAFFSYLDRELRPRQHVEFGPAEDLDASKFAPGSVDSVLIKGTRTVEAVVADTNNALRFLRSGGVMIWHGFCPDSETLRRHDSARACTTAVVQNFTVWKPQLSTMFWIRPSWMLVAVKS